MNTSLQHYLNPLHIFCRLRGLGLAKKPAFYVCYFYEYIIFNPFLLVLKKIEKTIFRRIRSKEPKSNGSWLK